MSNETAQDVDLSSEVQVIRNILFGEQIENFQKRIDALEKLVSTLQKENKILRKSLETETEEKFQALITRIDQMEMEQTKSNQTLQKDFSIQLKEMSKRLLSFEDKQGGLIASLAKALENYKNNPSE